MKAQVPGYQWKVNGGNVGSNSSTYSYAPANGDVVSVVLTSNATCTTGNPATSNTISMQVSTSAPATPSAPAGINSFCPPANGLIFTVASVSGATSYNWSFNGSAILPTGWTIVSGAGTNTITVNVSSAAAIGNVDLLFLPQMLVEQVQ